MLSICSICCQAQHRKIDSLRNLISHCEENRHKIALLRDLGSAYGSSFPDSGYYFASQGADLARRLSDQKDEAICTSLKSTFIVLMGNIPTGLQIGLNGLFLAEHSGDSIAIYDANSALGLEYYYQNDFKISNEYYFKCLTLSRSMGDEDKIMASYEFIGNVYFKLNDLDSAIYFTKIAYSMSAAKMAKISMADELNNLGDTYSKLYKNELALGYYRLAMNIEMETNDLANSCQSYLGVAIIHKRVNQNDSALNYAYHSMSDAISLHFYEGLIDASNLIASLYESEKKTDSAFKYLKLTLFFKDSLFNQAKSKAVENLTFEENSRQQQIATQKKAAEYNHVRNLQLLAIGVFIPIFFIGVLLLSRTKVKPRVVEFLGILSLLLLFEFISDLMYPYLSQWTNDSPIWEMVFFVLLATLLEPLNFKLEHWVKEHLVRTPVTSPPH